MWATWPDMSPVIQGCAEEAFKQGFTVMFGVQHYGECWSSKTAESNYNKYGEKKNGCVNGVGKQNANFVYRMKGTVLNFSPIKCLFFKNILYLNYAKVKRFTARLPVISDQRVEQEFSFVNRDVL